MKSAVCIALTVLLLLAAPAVLLVWGFALPAQYDASFLGQLQYKCARLETAPGPRLVIVGGSSVAFGIDSAALQSALPGYTVVNFGLYAGLGTTAMLELSEAYIQPGDLVIVSPEQQQQALSGYFNADAMWQALDGAFGLLPRLDASHWGQLAGRFPSFAAAKFSAWRGGQPPAPTGIYSNAAFDPAGDLRPALFAANTLPGGVDPNNPIALDPAWPDQTFVDTLNAYTDALTQKGATVWYHLCPMNRLALEENADPHAYVAALQQKLHCPIVGNPEDSLLRAEWFFDTNFHLNASGRALNTRRWARDIKAMLGDSSPTTLPLPSMPPLAAPTLAEGQQADEALFLYTPAGEGWAVTGLRPAGLSSARLTLPTTHEGKPVTVLAREALAGAASLEQLTLPASLALIEDGAFKGCPALKQIDLELATPARCRVSQGLLTGTQARLLVPPDALSDYKLDYFWSQHAGRIFAAEQ